MARLYTANVQMYQDLWVLLLTWCACWCLQVVLGLKDCNTALEAAMQRLAVRGQQVAYLNHMAVHVSAQAAALNMASMSPATSAAMSMAPLPGAGMGSLPAPPGVKQELPAPLPPGPAGVSASAAGSTSVAGAAGPPGSGTPMAGAAAGPSSAAAQVAVPGSGGSKAAANISEQALAESKAVVEAATSEAKLVVSACMAKPEIASRARVLAEVASLLRNTAAKKEGAGDGEAGGVEDPGADDDKDGGWLGQVMTGCVGMLYTLQKCSSEPMPGQVVEASLDAAMAALKPRHEANAGVYNEIADAVAALKAQLTKAT